MLKLLTWLFLIFPAGDDGGSGRIIASVDSSLTSVGTVSCEWTYTKSVSLLEDDITASGTLFMDRDSGVLEWHRKTPAESSLTFVRGDVRGTSVTKENKQIYKRISAFIESRIKGSPIPGPKEFKRTASLSPAGEYAVTMVPAGREAAALFDRMVLFFDRKELVLKRVELTDACGDVTVIRISSVKLGR